MISGFLLFCIVLVGLVCAGGPILLAWGLRRRLGGALASFFWGCGVYLVFVLGLEQTSHTVMAYAPAAQSLWFTVLYSGMAAMLFEGLGRLSAFRWLMKEHHTGPDALLFGLGMGWIAALILLGADMLYTAALGFALNRDPAAFAGTEAAAAVQALALQLRATPAGEVLLAGLDRVLAVGLQMALAYLMMTSVACRRARWTFAAMGLQLTVSCASVLAGALIGGALIGAAVQLVGCMAGAGLMILARRDWREDDPAQDAGGGTVITVNAPLPRRPL